MIQAGLTCCQVTLGIFGHEEEVISNPLSPEVIKDIIYSKCSPHGEREAVLQQELVIHIGWIISNTPDLFSGMLKIRIGYGDGASHHHKKRSLWEILADLICPVPCCNAVGSSKP